MTALSAALCNARSVRYHMLTSTARPTMPMITVKPRAVSTAMAPLSSDNARRTERRTAAIPDDGGPKRDAGLGARSREHRSQAVTAASSLILGKAALRCGEYIGDINKTERPLRMGKRARYMLQFRKNREADAPAFLGLIAAAATGWVRFCKMSTPPGYRHQ